MKSVSIDMAGKKCGRLTVLEMATKLNGQIAWLCQCDCGRTVIVRGNTLRSASPKMGCAPCAISDRRIAPELRKKRKYRSRSPSPEYQVWLNMRSRCHNPKNNKYKYYGGRGISICDRWKKFRNFISDMGPRPSSKHSIDRRDNDGNYSPENCKWSTQPEQLRNRSNNVYVVFKGETRLLMDVLKDVVPSVQELTVRNRINRGWPIEKALFQPRRI